MHDRTIRRGKSFFSGGVHLLALVPALLRVAFLHDGGFRPADWAYFGILLCAACVVYTLKAFRLYVLIVGDGVPFLRYVAVFAKTSFVNIALPFKIGELYRIYGMGNLTRQYLKGFFVVALDRFVDCSALLTMLAVLSAFGRAQFGLLPLLLLSLGVFLLLSYLVLPGMLRYWNEYFMAAASSQRHLRALFAIGRFRAVYAEVRDLVRGRFFVMFMLSLLSWACEIGALVACRRFFAADGGFVMDYLASALSGGMFVPQRNFVAVSLMVLLAAFAAAYTLRLVRFGVKHGR